MNDNVTAVIGASGFIGKAIATKLARNNLPVRAVTRFKTEFDATDIDVVELGNLFQFNEQLFDGIETTVYCSGIAHNNLVNCTEKEFLRVNVQSPVQAMEMAIQSRVKYFIFISSINVMSAENDLLDPKLQSVDLAVKGKIEVELNLKRLAKISDIKLLIVRCPMIYGANCPGNFPKLVSLVDSKLPLPLKSAKNKRSILFIENLTGFICYWISLKDKSSGEVNLFDSGNSALADILEYIYLARGIKIRLFTFPIKMLTAILTVLGKGSLAKSLLSESIVVPTNYQNNLDWTPEYSSLEGISQTLDTQFNNKKI